MCVFIKAVEYNTFTHFKKCYEYNWFTFVHGPPMSYSSMFKHGRT